MGTNYYAIPIKKIDELKNKKKLSIEEAGTMKGLIPIIKEYFNSQIDKIKPIHIGKSSAGWEFLFNLNEKKYYNDRESLILFLKNNKIVNEFSIEFSFDEFWNTIVENRKNVKKNVNGNGNQEYNKYITINNLEFLDCEFC
jgi:hypothetical protein